MCNRLAVAVLLALVFTPRASLAHQSIVPDQFPTIQAAIDANTIGYNDTIYVRDGDYPEVLTPHSYLWLIALPTVSTSPASPSLGMARVRSITTAPGTGGFVLLVRGFRFKEAVSLSLSGRRDFEGCWFEAGLTVRAGSTGHVWNCIVLGSQGLNLDGGTTMEVAMTTVIGGSIVENPPGSVQIHDNVAIGSGLASGPATGIYCWSDLSAIRNYVRGYVNGIYSNDEASEARDNVIEDCPGAGIKADRVAGSYPITGNTVRRSGRGIDVTVRSTLPGLRSPLVSGNVIEAATGEGIYSRGGLPGGALEGNTVLSPGGNGIDAGACFTTVSGNRVVDAGGAGLVLPAGGSASVTGNVFGHSHGSGVVGGVGVLQRNTSYLNAGTGYDISGGSGSSIDHNIACANSGAGLRWSGAAPAPGCDDWFGNLGGDLSGVSAGATDVSLDPLLCNPAIDDVGLQAGSPLASLAGCGQVGALGVGCATAGIGPGATAAGEVLALAAMPNPTAGEVRFAWTAPTRGAELAIFDVAGQRRWSRALAGTRGDLAWKGLGENGCTLAPGVYFARLTAGGRTTTRRVTLAP
jgi:hypothetical protein